MHSTEIDHTDWIIHRRKHEQIGSTGVEQQSVAKVASTGRVWRARTAPWLPWITSGLLTIVPPALWIALAGYIRLS
jgi:hypothetical protein